MARRPPSATITTHTYRCAVDGAADGGGRCSAVGFARAPALGTVARVLVALMRHQRIAGIALQRGSTGPTASRSCTASRLQRPVGGSRRARAQHARPITSRCGCSAAARRDAAARREGLVGCRQLPLAASDREPNACAATARRRGGRGARAARATRGWRLGAGAARLGRAGTRLRRCASAAARRAARAATARARVVGGRALRAAASVQSDAGRRAAWCAGRAVDVRGRGGWKCVHLAMFER